MSPAERPQGGLTIDGYLRSARSLPAATPHPRLDLVPALPRSRDSEKHRDVASGHRGAGEEAQHARPLRDPILDRSWARSVCTERERTSSGVFKCHPEVVEYSPFGTEAVAGRVKSGGSIHFLRGTTSVYSTVSIIHLDPPKIHSNLTLPQLWADVVDSTTQPTDHLPKPRRPLRLPVFGFFGAGAAFFSGAGVSAASSVPLSSSSAAASSGRA